MKLIFCMEGGGDWIRKRCVYLRRVFDDDEKRDFAFESRESSGLSPASDRRARQMARQLPKTLEGGKQDFGISFEDKENTNAH